ncbi:unnamed protein product [Peronospora destructor]|uniref:Uncharacterized protein n=1 Tax=Peronospora destructor TaxID=86335 RepID=A0AAV0V8A6_9STRA|nr:unnamed protein product [Peronospora destructor]
MPLSQIDITGCNDCTLILSIFISEIPHTSVEEVYAAVLAYFDGIPTAMKRHFNVNARRVRLNNVDSPVVYRRSTFKGATVVCSELTPSHGMVHIDAIVDDPMHPVSVTRRSMSVTLRWIVVYNYNILPDDPALKNDLEIIRPILNGRPADRDSM